MSKFRVKEVVRQTSWGPRSEFVIQKRTLGLWCEYGDGYQHSTLEDAKTSIQNLTTKDIIVYHPFP